MASERIKRKDSGLLPWIASGVVLSLVLGVGAYLFFKVASPEEPQSRPDTFGSSTTITGPRTSIKLYFPSKDSSSLVPEDRDIAQSPELTVMVRETVEELIRGPRTASVPSFPAGARVKSVFVDDSGVAYVNFSRELQSEYPGGAWTETLTIYSLVNTLTTDFPDEIKAVQLLVEGSEIPTLAGHIDTSSPFTPNTALNRG